ncbi:MAG: hypothetical protein WBQ21_10235 [Solirubrobacteraceae bacterium]
MPPSTTNVRKIAAKLSGHAERIGTVLDRVGNASVVRWIPKSALGPVTAVTLLTLLTVVVFRQQLFDHWTFPWDFLGSYTTTPAYIAAVFEGGHIPSWSPFVASGFPVNVDPQAGTYFPAWWLLGGLGIPATLRVLTTVQVAHVLFGSLGVLILAHARRLKWSWAVLAAVAYLFFGGFYGEAEHADIFRGFSYLPWLLWSLTPPDNGGRWVRLAALPPLAWLIVSGAYPGQLVSFSLAGFTYVTVALYVGGRGVWHRYRYAMALAALAAGAVCVAVLIPYLHAEQSGELHRIFEPTAAVRASESISPLDLLGLYLNNFAWTYDGTITAWAVGIPILVGLACLRLETLRKQAPLAACGAVALVLAMAPKIGVIGRAMTSVRPLFPSRFPAAEYKSVVAVALVVLAAEAWSQTTIRRRGLAPRAAFAGSVLLVGALFAPSTYAQPTRALWLVVVVIFVSFTLVLIRMRAHLLVCLLVVLVVIDGVREINDYRLLGHTSPWQVPSSEMTSYRARDGYVRKLPKLLAQAPESRPARIPPAVSLSIAPTGNNLDAAGWVGDGYHMIDYGGTIERVLWQADHSPVWSAMLLAPWHGYTFSCTEVGCRSGTVHLPSPAQWRPSGQVRTLTYGVQSITYEVSIRKPMLMIENELAIDGWTSDTQKVRSVNAGIPLRAWWLSPGKYTFSASYKDPTKADQELALVIALIAWLGCALILYRKRTKTVVL